MEEKIAQDVKRLRDAVTASRELQAKGDLQGAISRVNEIERELQALGSDDATATSLQAAIHSEKALIYQRLRNARSAIQSHKAAEEVLRKLTETTEENAQFQLQLATTLINMTGLYAQERLFAEGEACAAEAVELLAGHTDEKHAKSAEMLRIGALQNLSSILVATRQFPKAEEALADVNEIGVRLVADGNKQLLPQIMQASGQYAGLLAARGAREDAEKALANIYAIGVESVTDGNEQILPLLLQVSSQFAGLLTGRGALDAASEVVERAERWSEAIYNAKHPSGLRLYVGTQMQLVSVRYAQKRIDQAEDHLWKAMDIAGDGISLTNGAGFYLMVLRHDDATLDAGGLPKDEVVESLDEVMGRINEAKDIPAELRDLLNGRYAAVVERDQAKAQGLHDQVVAANSRFPGVVQVLPLLKADLKWLEDGAPAQPHPSDRPANGAAEA